MAKHREIQVVRDAGMARIGTVKDLALGAHREAYLYVQSEGGRLLLITSAESDGAVRTGTDIEGHNRTFWLCTPETPVYGKSDGPALRLVSPTAAAVDSQSLEEAVRNLVAVAKSVSPLIGEYGKARDELDLAVADVEEWIAEIEDENGFFQPLVGHDGRP